MTTSLARPAHWDDPDPVPGFLLQRRRFDVGVGEVWEGRGPDDGPVLIRLVDVTDDAASRAKALRVAGGLPLLGHPDLDPVRQVVPRIDGLALVRSPAPSGLTTLAAVMARRRSLSAAEVVGLADRLGRVLGHLHDNGVTHGRLTAGDVLLQPTGRSVLTGFGVAGIQGAGGRPADDVAALATLLVSLLGEGKFQRSEALRATLMALADAGVDGHGLADEASRCSDSAPIRLRPSPGRVPIGSRPMFVAPELSSLSPASASGVATLDAAVRALRADARQAGARQGGARQSKPWQGGARQSIARHRSQPSDSRTRRAPRGPAEHSSRRRLRTTWPWRIAPAAAVLLVTLVVGWRFLGSSATADARRLPASASVPSPDRATIQRLDAARSSAFAAGVTAQLTMADAVHSPALAADVDAMSMMLGHHGRARGLAPRLVTVTVLSRTPDRAVVRVVDELPPYDFVTPTGQIIARAPGHVRQAHEVRLRLVSGQWRYEAVTRAAAPAPSAKPMSVPGAS